MQFQKISIPTPWKVIGNSEGVGGSRKPKFLKDSRELNLNFKRGGGIQTKKPSMGGVWIFSGTIQYPLVVPLNEYTLHTEQLLVKRSTV